MPEISLSLNAFESWYSSVPFAYDFYASHPTASVTRDIRVVDANSNTCVISLETPDGSSSIFITTVRINDNSGVRFLSEYENLSSFIPSSSTKCAPLETDTVLFDKKERPCGPILQAQVQIDTDFKVELIVFHTKFKFKFVAFGENGCLSAFDYSILPSRPVPNTTTVPIIKYRSPYTSVGQIKFIHDSHYFLTLGMLEEKDEWRLCLWSFDSEYPVFLKSFEKESYLAVEALTAFVLTQHGTSCTITSVSVSDMIANTVSEEVSSLSFKIPPAKTVTAFEHISCAIASTPTTSPMTNPSNKDSGSVWGVGFIFGCDDESIILVGASGEVHHCQCDEIEKVQEAVDPDKEAMAGVDTIVFHPFLPSIFLATHCSGLVSVWNIELLLESKTPSFVHCGHIGDTGPASWLATESNPFLIVSAGYKRVIEDGKHSYGRNVIQIWKGVGVEGVEQAAAYEELRNEEMTVDGCKVKREQ